MKPARRSSANGAVRSGEVVELRARVAEAEAALLAIRSGEVDAVVVAGKSGPQVFTLQGAEHAYRVLIESMNEGALTLAADEIIFYANQRFAKMVQCPQEQLVGDSFRRFLSTEDRAILRPLLKGANPSGAKIQVLLRASHGATMPAQISIRPLARNGYKQATFGMVVTDLTEATRTGELLRALTRRGVQAQEAERGRVALELHDDITQLLCAIVVRSQTLADQLSGSNGPAKQEAIKLRKMLGLAAGEVERISQNLRPGVLVHLGLSAVVHDTSEKFAARTGVLVKLAGVELTARLPAGIELALYRILQEALENVAKHAHARHVSVGLKQIGGFIRLAIKDDGIGFDPEHHLRPRNGRAGLGMLSMRERATYVSGVLKVKSRVGRGTTIRAQIPLVERTGGGTFALEPNF